MKKKIFIILILFGSILFMPLSTKALDAELSITCDNASVKVGEEASCNIDITPSNGGVSAVDLKYSPGSNISIISATKGSVLTEGSVDEGHIQVYGDTPATSKFTVASLRIKLGEEAQVGTTEELTLSEIILTDENDDEVEVGDINLSINVVEDSSSSEPATGSGSGSNSGLDNTNANQGEKTTVKAANNISNPKTVDVNVFAVIALLITMCILGFVGYKKVKNTK